jgi:hypothetical protein
MVCDRAGFFLLELGRGRGKAVFLGPELRGNFPDESKGGHLVR